MASEAYASEDASLQQSSQTPKEQVRLSCLRILHQLSGNRARDALVAQGLKLQMLGRGFTVKCKALTKATRARIDVVRRRADAKQRFLKDDLSNLLSKGLDINAYGRTEEFIAGKDLLSCYDFIEYSCGYTGKQLSRMQKQGDCPEECREAVASLMYAAARFSDLPELRELRDIFQQKYGNSLESFVNLKFVEKLSSRPPASEKRLQVLQDIASEFSIKWDSRGFERRMAISSAVAQVDVQKVDTVKPRPMILEEKKSRVRDYGEDNILKIDESNHRFPGRKETIEYKEKSVLRAGGSSMQGDGGDLLSRGRLAVTESKLSYLIEKGDTELKVERSKSSSHGKIILDNSNVRTGYMRPSNDIHNPRKGENKDALSCKKAEFAPSSLEPLGRTENAVSYLYSSQDSDVLNSVRKEVDKSKPCSSYALPPPYVNSKDNNTPHPPYMKPKEDEHRHGRGSMNVSSYKLRPNIGLDIGDGEEQLIEPSKVKTDDSEKVIEKTPFPKPQSIRRKHHTPSSSYNAVDALEDDVGAVVRRGSSSRRNDHSGKGSKILFEEEHHKKDDEERMIDKLLIHYCKKPSSDDAGKLRIKPGPRKKADAGESSLGQSRDNGKPVVFLKQSTRSVSLPHQQPTSPQPEKIFTRANSFQPDNNQAHYVHPKLPDYDDLAARFAALKGT